MITISHTHADGTLVEGSRKGDGVYEVLKGLYGNWRYFRSLGQIGIGLSRDKAADMYKINRAAEALRAAGHAVTVEVDDSAPRPFAEVEADRYARADDRAEYHGERAEVAQSRADGHWRGERAILDGIPMGQPILVGHHSERRHRRDLERADSHMRRGLEEIGKRDYHENRAEAAATHQQSRENVRTTLRRIETLEAEQRKLQRRVDGTDPYQGHGQPATGSYLERLTARLAEIADQLAYWREHVAGQEAAGVKIWSRADFAKGDYMQFMGTWYEVLRVSAKSVTIPAMINDGPVVTKAGGRCDWTDTIPYHKVTGRKSADEMAAIVAESDRRLAESAVG
jgi:hypothetical protein